MDQSRTADEFWSMPRTRRDAILSGAKQFFTGRPCAHGHVVPRFTSTKHCQECARLRSGARFLTKVKCPREATGRKLAQSLGFVFETRKQARDAGRTIYFTGTKCGHGHVAPREVRSGSCVVCGTERSAMRRALVRSAMPRWLTKEQRAEIRSIYGACRALSAASGTEYHVDHIVPLIHPLVCGLHVPWNLQIITASDNMKKNSKFSVGEPCAA